MAGSEGERDGRGRSGVAYMAAGAFFFSVMSLLVKMVGERVPPMEVVLVRGAISLVMAAVLVRRAGVSPWGNRKGLLVWRGLVGFASLSCFYWSVVYLPLGEATVIQYTNPVWTALLSAWLLRERLTRIEVAASAAALGGVALIARPGFLFGSHAAGLDPGTVLVALAGAVCAAMAYVSVRRLSRTEHPHVIVFYFTLVTVPTALPFLAAGAVWPTPREWLLLVGVGVTALLGQVFLTGGLQREQAGRATAIGYVQIVFAAGWSALFFAQYPDAAALAGALLVLAGVLVLARRRPPARAERVEEATPEAL